MGQIERAIHGITNIFGSASLIKQSEAGGTQKLTIADNVIVGSDQACRSCLIHVPTTNAGTVHLTIKDETADADDFLVPAGIPIPVPVDNLSDLHFYGTDDGDLIHILWRN